MPARTAVVLGSSGLVGSVLWPKLLASGRWSNILLIVRRSQAGLPSGVTQKVVPDFAELPTALQGVVAQDLFVCVGTTIRKAGSRAAFEKVDLDYPLMAAQALTGQGLEHVLVISALGASSRSGIFYNRVKGRLEDDLSALPVANVSIFRPSLLVGDRDEVRWAERLSGILARPLVAVCGRWSDAWAPVSAEAVASAMCQIALESLGGNQCPSRLVIDSAAMQRRYRCAANHDTRSVSGAVN